ncbi:MAG: HAD family hydrolase [Verrucomicrobiota bacterium]
MIRAILFDMGGTLDGDGLHWLDRFVALYENSGLKLPREKIRAAFDEAERQSLQDEDILTADFAQMIAEHVRWQFAYLELDDHALAQQIVEGFIAPVRAAVVANAQLLAELAARGFALGVASNGCGNVDKLCADFGFAPYLAAIVDSRRVGLCKPDPAFFFHAAKAIRAAPETIVMVGDSFERDVRPAKLAGMKTAWLEGASARECSDPSLIDFRLRKLADLPAALSAA